MSSTHEARVIRIQEVLSHPNADQLEIVAIGGYKTCVRKGDFQIGDLAVFIEPDTLVDVSRPEFAFLASRAKGGVAKIGGMRLRGQASFGLLIRAPEGLAVGEDAWGRLGLAHYDPEEADPNGENTGGPPVPVFKYDMESWKKYPDLFHDDEWVQVTEKIHGMNARFVFAEDQLHVGTHTNWKKRPEEWWKTSRIAVWKAAHHYGLEQRLAQYPNHVFYGEVYGQVRGYRYGVPPGEVRLAIFDILYAGQWLPPDRVEEICEELRMPHVPVLYYGPFRAPWGTIDTLADGQSVVTGATHIREGCVIKPRIVRTDDRVGRVIAKVVSVDYLAGKRGKQA